jgi:hypothetical protein
VYLYTKHNRTSSSSDSIFCNLGSAVQLFRFRNNPSAGRMLGFGRLPVRTKGLCHAHALNSARLPLADGLSVACNVGLHHAGLLCVPQWWLPWSGQPCAVRRCGLSRRCCITDTHDGRYSVHINAPLTTHATREHTARACDELLSPGPSPS